MDPHLEMAEVQRRVYEAQGPALLFEKVKGSPFPAVSNLFGTLDRSRWLFRDTLARIQRVMEARMDPAKALKRPFRYLPAALAAWHALPKKKWFAAPVMARETRLSLLPQIQSWPGDGGPFITLPQVFTQDPERPGIMKTNVGMYRIQLAGNEYLPDKEIGLHYQIHRGIGVHHSKALQKGQPLRVSIFVGGPPALTFSAVMPLPEGLSEVMFAGMLGGRKFRYKAWGEHLLAADADFCLVGTIAPGQLKPEGPFGDHLGYYSLQHPYPVMKVEKVFHRRDAVWPFTVVGRPPQEDTSFGALIHEITSGVVSSEIPGVQALHAVDAAGVHPLLLSIGSERYVPFEARQPREILTQANAILGFGQASLAKFLFIIAKEDNPALDIHHKAEYLQHVLARARWERDLHFHTRTTIDTLDYSGTAINEGSKLVIAAAGAPVRTLATSIPSGLPERNGFHHWKLALPGIALVSGPKFENAAAGEAQMQDWVKGLSGLNELEGLPLIVVCDDAEFAAAKENNFFWVTFTRANPSHDVYGVDAFNDHKHWGCKGPLVIDARIKPHHAPPLIEDAKVTERVNQLAVKGGPLHGII